MTSEFVGDKKSATLRPELIKLTPTGESRSLYTVPRFSSKRPRINDRAGMTLERKEGGAREFKAELCTALVNQLNLHTPAKDSIFFLFWTDYFTFGW